MQNRPPKQLPDLDAHQDVVAEPTLGGKVAKGVGKGLIHGLFNNW